MRRLPCFVALVLALGACVAEQPVDLVVRGTIAVSGEQSVTVLVTAGPCPSVQDAVQGAVGGVVYDETAALGTDLPAVGILEDRSYAFTALFREPRCLPTRFGCVERNPLDGTVDVVVELVEPFAGAVCPPDTFCDGGMCAPGVEPPGGTCDAEGSGCTTTDGTSGVCCGGDCRVDPTGSCPPMTTCGDTSSDRFHCGECDHGCPSDLSCGSGLCRPIPEPMEILLEVDADTLAELQMNEGHLAFLWQAPAISGPGDESLLAITNSQRIADDAAGDGAMYVRIPRLEEVPETAWYDGALGGTRIGLATLIVAPDVDRSGVLELDEARIPDASGPGWAVAEDIVLVASEGDVAREAGGVGVTFPEGIPGGVVPYRGGGRADGGGLTPTTNTMTRLRLCAGDPSCFRVVN